jgi:hypothetical protein
MLQTPIPCKNLAINIELIEVDKIHRIHEIINNKPPDIRTILRPNLSDRGPSIICAVAPPSNHVESVEDTASSLILNSLAIRGKNGMYISLDMYKMNS